MINRVARLPKAKLSEVLFMGAAGAAVLTPLYLVMPGKNEQLHVANQTSKWAPRWEKNVSYFTPHVERGTQRIEPPVSRLVQSTTERLPLEKMAQGTARRIQNTVDRFGPKSGSS
jgi:hypothetical protein